MTERRIARRWPSSVRPPDFDRFWSRTLDELRAVPLKLSASEHDSGTPEIRLHNIDFQSIGSSTIRGYLLEWDDHRPRPLVVHSHGYNSQCIPRIDWARTGLNVLGVDIRGFGRSADALPFRSRFGYMLTGIDAPDHHVLRGAVCDYIRAVEAGREMLGPRITRMVLQGTSFAGGLALMGESLLHVADFLAVGVPTFGWVEGRGFFVQGGSGAEITRYLQQRPESAEDVMVVLRYFDTVNFAPDVRCPTLVGVGRRDDVVPAPTVYAVADHLGGPYRVMEFPVSHTSSQEEELWRSFEDTWIDMALNGVPADFGKE